MGKSKIISDTIEYILDPSKKESTPGIFVSAGEISEDYDKVDWHILLEDYTNMRNGGAVESTTVSMLKYPMLRAGYTITHENDELKKYVEWCFNQLLDTFGDHSGHNELINHLFLALDYGCSFFEKVYEYGVYTPDNKITNIIRRLAPFKLETIDEFLYDSQMRFSGIKHERRTPDAGNSFVNIPIEKLFFYAHNVEFGDPRGRSELRPARNLYKIKKDILLATARSQQRGAGIPEIKYNGSGMTEEMKKKLEAVGRTVGNMKNGYIITDADITVTLHELKTQGTPEHMLEFINREMFFNTLTEFMTSGIGQNGSRSSTSEHKGSYELKYGVVTQSIEQRLNLIIKEMVDISYFGPQKKYPEYKVNAIQQLDLQVVADSIANLYEKQVLIKREGDEEFIRGLFNMPKIPKTIIDNKPVLGIKPKLNKFSLLLTQEEQLSFVQKTFDVNKVGAMYIKLQEETNNIMNSVISKYIAYICKKIKNKEEVDLKYTTELSNKLQSLYRTGFNTGVTDVDREIQLAKKKKLSEYTESTINPGPEASQSIKRFAGKLLYSVKVSVEEAIDKDWDKSSQSMDEFLATLNPEDMFKMDKSTLSTSVLDGYVEGRDQALVANEEKIELYYYNSIMDLHLCDVCASFTGAVMTLEEAQSVGLAPGRGRVNSHCLGKNRCRCNLLVYQLKGEFQ